jgi:predicted nucleic acid-binding protein
LPHIVDARVALKWLVVEENSAQAVSLLESGSDLFAPRLIVDEVANALWKKCRRKHLTPPEALERIRLLPRYFKGLLDTSDAGVVLELALAIDHSVYDCLYLQAAVDRGIPLVTADQSLSRKARMVPGITVYDLSQWTSPQHRS